MGPGLLCGPISATRKLSQGELPLGKTECLQGASPSSHGLLTGLALDTERPACGAACYKCFLLVSRHLPL